MIVVEFYRIAAKIHHGHEKSGDRATTMWCSVIGRASSPTQSRESAVIAAEGRAAGLCGEHGWAADGSPAGQCGEGEWDG
jgi:hypothetical protein